MDKKHTVNKRKFPSLKANFQQNKIQYTSTLLQS